jgi:DNA-binding response OmpR family regulator
MDQTSLPELTCLCGTVLVVDDEPANRLLLREQLETQGHSILEADSGEEALRQAAELLPDVVLLDLMMPRMDGFEVCRRLKGNPATAHIPVLMVTAVTERRDRLLGIQAGANDFFTKPIDFTEVILRVRSAIWTKRLFDQWQASRQRHQELERVHGELAQAIEWELGASLGTAATILKALLEHGGTLGERQVFWVRETLRILEELAQRLRVISTQPGAKASAESDALGARPPPGIASPAESLALSH